MGYKKLGLDIKNENAGIILKFKEETEILMEETGEKTLPLPDGTENFLIDLDALKEIVLSNKKNLAEVRVSGDFVPEIFALAALIDNFYYKTGTGLEITKNDNIAEIRSWDTEIRMDEHTPSVIRTFSGDFMNSSEREEIFSLKEIFPYVFKGKFETNLELSENSESLLVNNPPRGITFEFADGVTAKTASGELSEFYTTSAFNKTALSVKADRLCDNFYIMARKEEAAIVFDHDSGNIIFSVGPAEAVIENGTLKRVHGNMEDYKFKKIINALLEQVQLNVKESIQDITEHFKEDQEYNDIVKNVKNMKINK
jgi:hypothetical protein